ncbi:hypothetical protein HZA98_01135 [Candidatus Woesearchaeota archaeon]|nr:hypothetical protein [Candidatus Woesearchaeota archaeon]
MKQRTKYLLAVAGFTGALLGTIITVVMLGQEKYGIATAGAAILMAGILLLAFSFED